VKLSGVAWAMGSLGDATGAVVVLRVVAVAGEWVLIRDGKSLLWRHGSYFSGAAADDAAARMTSDMEAQGMVLVAGPAVFATGDDMRHAGDPRVAPAICGALAIEDAQPDRIKL